MYHSRTYHSQLKPLVTVNVGGNWDNGANYGAFTFNVNNAPSNANTNIGAHHERFKNKNSADVCPLPLGKNHMNIPY